MREPLDPAADHDVALLLFFVGGWRQPRIQSRGFLKLFLRFFGFALLAQSQSKLKVRGRVVRRGVNRRAKLGNRAFEVSGIKQTAS